MTTSQETFSDTTRRGQETFASALQVWADSIQKFYSSLPTMDARVPNEVVDNFFNVAEQVLATQREFTKNLVTATTSVATSAASASQNAAKTAAAKKD
ncbi:MAG: hypothetical protein M3460_06040 [Actinomycetota bacterium]|nr:hypothetical protein [Actinomycetota bacterium]